MKNMTYSENNIKGIVFESSNRDYLISDVNVTSSTCHLIGIIGKDLVEPWENKEYSLVDAIHHLDRGNWLVIRKSEIYDIF